MRLRNVKNAKEKLVSSTYFVEKPIEWKGKWYSYFKNRDKILAKQLTDDMKIHIEIGCGKGQFLIEMAKKYPDIYFIGIEKYESVLVRAIEKVENEKLENIAFICFDALALDKVFDHEIDTIYLNFSDPWPKNRHEKRRLTSPLFLNIYENLFQYEKTIIQKTDNILLFAYSLEQFSKAGYILEKISLDSANTDIENVETEYEQKFKKLGYKINYAQVIKK